MEDITKLNVFISSIQKDINQRIAKANDETAIIIRDDAKNLIANSMKNNGGNYTSSIKAGPTKINGNEISTEIYTDATVQAIGSGEIYNLGELLEYGTSPHIIAPVNAKALAFTAGSGEEAETVIVKKVKHPGTVAQPHFTTALVTNKNTYLENIDKAIGGIK